MTEFAASAPTCPVRRTEAARRHRRRAGHASRRSLLPTRPPPCWTPSAAREVLETVRRLNKEKGITVVWITHYMEEAVQADRVLVVQRRSASSCRARPAKSSRRWTSMRELHLDVPPMTDLDAQLRAAGHAAARRHPYRR